MGRPINKRFVGDTAVAGEQIQVSAWVPGDSQARAGFIVRQKGNSSYIVDTTGAGGAVGKCKLVNTTAAAAGQMTVKVFPYGSAQGAGATGVVHMRGKTVAVNAAGTGYSVNDVLTVVGGTGTAMTATVATVGGSGEVNSVTLTGLGDYTVLPSVTGAATTVAPSGGTGATLDLTFEVLSVVVSAGGADYVGASVTFSAGAATATATVTGGAVTAITVGTRGTYTVKPTVTIAATGSAPVEYASKIMSHLVDTFVGNAYPWKPQNMAIVAGEANIETA